MEEGEIIPFPVWINPLPVLEINLNLLVNMRNILIRGLEVRERVPFPFRIIQLFNSIIHLQT